MTYYKLYNPAGMDETLHYPLFHCLPYLDTHFRTLQEVRNKLKIYPDGVIIEADLDMPNVYKNINTGVTWKYNGKTWKSNYI